ncbi:hypothetical protein GCM10009608_59230 [Pseudonocardia alaniniphila]
MRLLPYPAHAQHGAIRHRLHRTPVDPVRPNAPVIRFDVLAASATVPAVIQKQLYG